MLKWRLMLTTLPFVALVTGVKAALEFGVGWGGAVEFADVGVVLTAGVFLTGFLLTGTISDYKEAEKLPAEVATTLELLEEILVLAASTRPSLKLSELRASLLTMTDGIRDWLYKRATSAQVFDTLSAFNGVLQTLERDGAGPYASRAVPQLAGLRKTISRMDVISRTGFLPPAYALLETLLGLILILVVSAKYKSQLAEFILVPVLTLIYVYMLRLIRDVDDPFDYSPDGQRRGGAEVELFPIEEYRARLKSRVG
ncbi:MAG: hypothetical protein SFW67_34080 [Myxococcaceae bacterium]|nr:hypothetical protein [Myxococcaceae bacterium]